METVPFNAVCPRCGAAFRCGVADAGPCVCTTVKLDDTTLAQLCGRYAGCLCIACLAECAAAGAASDVTGSREVPRPPAAQPV